MPTTLITGANRGLGLEFASQYARDGWRVIGCCREPGSANELNDLAREFDDVSVERLDVKDFGVIDSLAEKLSSEAIDILLNNAGIIGSFPIAECISEQHFGSLDYAVWENVMRTNTYAPVKIAEAFIEHVARSEQKKIATISSSVGSITEMMIPGVCYASSKTALNRAMTIVANAVKDRGITVTLYCPGYVKTRMDAFGYATVEIPESISGLRAIIAAQTLEDTGSFTRYDGSPIAW